jgi:prepilin signal peptidase PulO-like enzyme (type II secretory pathway)
VVAVLVLITISDLKTMIIPDEVIYPAIIIALIYAVTIPFFGSSATYALSIVVKNLLGALAAGMFFYSMILISGGKWMGGGDVKLAFFAGLILGWINVVVALFLAFITGSIYGLAMVTIGKRKMAEAIPFGPFIILGIFTALAFGPEIINWYLGIIIL